MCYSTVRTTVNNRPNSALFSNQLNQYTINLLILTMVQGYKNTKLGIIRTHDTTLEAIENTVAMSENNFKALVSLLPRLSTKEVMSTEIQVLKDKLTQMTFSTSTMSRQILIDTLQHVVDYNVFMNDVEQLTKPDIKVVCKIDRSQVV
jgi:hypothetical protein